MIVIDTDNKVYTGFGHKSLQYTFVISFAVGSYRVFAAWAEEVVGSKISGYIALCIAVCLRAFQFKVITNGQLQPVVELVFGSRKAKVGALTHIAGSIIGSGG